MVVNHGLASLYPRYDSVSVRCLAPTYGNSSQEYLRVAFCLMVMQDQAVIPEAGRPRRSSTAVTDLEKGVRTAVPSYRESWVLDSVSF